MENQEQPPVQQQPPTQVVKLEIGKVLGVIIAVVIVAVVAGMFLQNSYFQGNLTADEIAQICTESPENELCSSATPPPPPLPTATETLSLDAIKGIDLILAGSIEEGLAILEKNSDIDIELTRDLLKIDEKAAIAALDDLKKTSDIVIYDNDLQNAISTPSDGDIVGSNPISPPSGLDDALDNAIETFVATDAVAINTSLINDLTNEIAIYDKAFDAVASDILANDIEMVTKYADLDIKNAIQDYSVTKDIGILESDIAIIKTDVLREAGMSLLEVDIGISANGFDKVVRDFNIDGGYDFAGCLAKTDADTLAKMINGDFIAGIEKSMDDAVMTLGKNLGCSIVK